MAEQTETGSRGSGWEARPETEHGRVPPAASPGDAFRDAFRTIAEFREFAAYYLSAKIDGLKLIVRKLGILLGLALIGGLAITSVIVVAVVLLERGIAGTFSDLLPTHPWLGDIISAAIFLAIPVLMVMMGMHCLTGTFKGATVKKYERKQRQQRQQFGRDVRDDATRP